MKKKFIILLTVAAMIIPCITIHAESDDWETLYAAKIEEIRKEYKNGQRSFADPYYEAHLNLLFTLQDINFDGVPELYHTQISRSHNVFSTSHEYEEIYYIKDGAVVQGTIDSEYDLGLLPAYRERTPGDFTADRWQYAARNLSTGKVSFITNDANGSGATSHPERTVSELTFDKNSGVLKSTVLIHQDFQGYTEPQYLEGYEYIGIGTYFSDTPYDTGNLWGWYAPYIAPETQQNVSSGVESSLLTLYVGSYAAYNDGEICYIDDENHKVTPIIVGDRTLVPVRFITEAFAGSLNWDGENRIAALTVGNNEVKIYIDKPYITVNGETRTIDVPAQIIQDRTMVPLRAFAEAIGKSVDYYNGLIVIGDEKSVADMMSQDLDKYTSDNFSSYVVAKNKPELLKAFESDEIDVIVNTHANFKGIDYHITSTMWGYIYHSYTINGVVMKTSGGFDTCEIYFADMNPDDDNIEIIFVEDGDNFINTTVFEYSGNSAYEIESEIDSRFKGLNYDGITMNEDGSISSCEQYRKGGMWGLKKTYRLVDGRIVRDTQDYYEVNMPLLLSYWLKQEGAADIIDDVYVRCDKSYELLKAGDYFTILYDDENGNIYIRTTNGKEGWMPIPGYQDGMKICKPVFWRGG